MLESGFSFASLPNAVLIADGCIAGVYLLYIVSVATAWTYHPTSDRGLDERKLAVTAVGSFVTVNVAASSILLTGAYLFFRVGFGGKQVPTDIFTQLVLTSFWFVLSLLFGLISVSYLLNQIHSNRSVVENRLVIVPAAIQFGGTVGGACFFAITLFLL